MADAGDLDRDESNLIGGPQDGARVRSPRGRLPRRLYVHARWMGDGFAAWGRTRTKRFPCLYVFNGHAHQFKSGR